MKEEKALCGCYIDETRGALKVTDIEPKEYDSTLGGIFPEGSYHIFDYQFFYRNLQENVGKRLEAYLSAKLSISLEEADVSGIQASYAYTGKAIRPSVTVTCNDTVLAKGEDYKVTFSNNKKVGKANVQIQGIGNYTGTIKKTFQIVPKAVEGLEVNEIVENGKRTLYIQWEKQTEQTDGYELQYSTGKKFVPAKTKRILYKDNQTVAKIVKNLKTNANYYVRIRAYKTVSKKKYCSEWADASVHV